jgi:hypothetical protein
MWFQSEGGPGIGCLQERAERRLAGPRTAGPRGGCRTPAGRAGDQGKEERVKRPKLREPEAGRRIVKRLPPSNQGSAVGAPGVEGLKGGRRGRHRHVSGASRCEEGGVGLAGSGEPQAKTSGAQRRGELGNHRVRLHGSGRRVLHQGEGDKKHLPFGSANLRGEPRPGGDAGDVSQARLQEGAEQEELVLPAEGKGGRGGDQAGDSLGPRASVGLNNRQRGLWLRGVPAATSPSRRWVTHTRAQSRPEPPSIINIVTKRDEGHA